MGRAGTFVIVALIVGAVTFLIADSDEPDLAGGTDNETTAPADTEEPEPTQSPVEEDEPPAGFDRYEIEFYSFDHPESWSVDQRDTAVEISAPDSSAVMSFGLAPGGDIRSGISKFLELINENYGVLDVRGPTSTTIGLDPSDAVLVEGTATNDDDVRVDFRAFVVEGDDQNVAIAIFTSPGANESDVEAVLDSFSTLAPIQS